MNALEPFEPSRSGRGAPAMRALPDGRLVLNAAAARHLEGATHVQLLWDPETQQVALQPTSAPDPLAVKVTHIPSQAIVTSKEFLERAGIAIAQRVPLVWQDGMLLTPIDDPDNEPG